MVKIDFDLTSEGEYHTCEAKHVGDWIIFHCPACSDYERRLNWRTGKMVKVSGDNEFLHSGKYFSHENDHAFEQKN